MPRLNGLDFVVVGVFLVGAVGIAAFALAGIPEVAIAGIGVMLALHIVVARLNAVSNRVRSRKFGASLRRVNRKLDVVRDNQKVTFNKLQRLNAKLSTVLEDSADLGRDAEALRKYVSCQTSSVAEILQEVQRLRPELRGVRVSQQLLSQSVDETKTLFADTGCVQDQVAEGVARD